MKKLAGMQPYFFPYLGYFDLIYNADKWIVFDTPQYIRFGWVNRNRILNPQKAWTYITVPIKKNHRDTPINEMQISENEDWKDRIFRQLEPYKKHAPFYKEVISLIREVFQKQESSLSKLNVFALEKVCQFLKIPFCYSVFSEMNIQLGLIEEPGDWALRTCEVLGATTYINPPGGRSLYDPQKFQEKGIKLIIREFENMVYSCGPYQFEPALSIIDVLMWNSPKTIRDYLESKRIP
jgi:hypothetical protein